LIFFFFFFFKFASATPIRDTRIGPEANSANRRYRVNYGFHRMTCDQAANGIELPGATLTSSFKKCQIRWHHQYDAVCIQSINGVSIPVWMALSLEARRPRQDRKRRSDRADSLAYASTHHAKTLPKFETNHSNVRAVGHKHVQKDC
jgi:hypothetical protein